MNAPKNPTALLARDGRYRDMVRNHPGRNGIPFSKFHEAAGLWPGEMQEMRLDINNPEDQGLVVNAFFFGPPNEKLPVGEAARRAQISAAAVASEFKTLHDIVIRYEDIIRIRWGEKSGPQRERALLAAWPGMAILHRPDIRAYRTAPKQRSPRTEAAYMFPHISLEDLKRGSSILRFLNSRSRNPPAAFAASDLESIYIGIWGETVLPVDTSRDDGSEKDESTGNKKVYCIDLKSHLPEQYGRISVYKPARAKTRMGERPNVADGLLVLQIQQSILAFLVKFCKSMLHDKNIDGDLASASTLPEPPALHIGDGQWLSAVDVARETPYLVPGAANLQQMFLLVKSRLAEWRDHAFAMREDPQVYSDTVDEWSEHCPDRVPREDGRIHPDFKNKRPTGNFWDCTIASAISEIYEGLFIWSFFHDQLETIVSFRNQENFNHQEEEPPAYLETVKRLRFILEGRVIKKAKLELMRRWPASPPNRSLFVEDSKAHKLRLRNPRNHKDDLWWLLSEISNEESLCPLDDLATELNKLIQTEKKQKDRCTAFVARFIADLGLECEFRKQLRMLCPRAFVLRGKILGVKLEEDEKLLNWTLTCVKPLTELLFAAGPSHAGNKFLRLGADGDPTSGRFYYPVHERRTKENNEALQAAERNLDALWDRFDAHMRQHVSAASYEALQKFMPKKDEIQRTPDWKEPSEIAHEASATVNLDSGDNDGENLSDQTSSLNLTGKMKTGAQSSQETPTDQNGQPITTSAPLRGPVFSLEETPYKVFSTLFYQPLVQSAPGEVAWTDFVHAMEKIDFVPEKLYGLVWRFTPGPDAKFSVEDAVHFHEPHPQDKFPFYVARRYGRRLNRMYGLDASSFALE